ncbi:MAG: hypothetical protein HC884_10505 [Chloroflexaceae bacterium]|nr:hypothetical protein [Chloroflexaceae bacterium]
MTLWPRLNPFFVSRMTGSSAAWAFPAYRQAILSKTLLDSGRWVFPPSVAQLLIPGSFIEWRYFALLSPSFHGIVGAALFNPFGLFGQLGESGLLLILAGVFEAPDSVAAFRETAQQGRLQELCWMHMFPAETLRFSQENTTLEATHEGIDLCLEQETPNRGAVRFSTPEGIRARVRQVGLAGPPIDPCFADDLQRVPAAHWIVHTASPVALVEGEIDFAQGSLSHLPPRNAPRYPDFVSAALSRRVEQRRYTVSLADDSGYYEHSYGINPLPLHGWDFLFVPDAARGQSLVLQTYLRSTTLRLLEVVWRDGETGEPRYTRFDSQSLSLRWEERTVHPEIKATVPLKRRLDAHNAHFHLEVENTVAHHIPFLRPRSLVVRHFFMGEELSFTTWRLRDASGKVLAEAVDQRSGGEIASRGWFCHRLQWGRGGNIMVSGAVCHLSLN